MRGREGGREGEGRREGGEEESARRGRSEILKDYYIVYIQYISSIARAHIVRTSTFDLQSTGAL